MKTYHYISLQTFHQLFVFCFVFYIVFWDRILSCGPGWSPNPELKWSTCLRHRSYEDYKDISLCFARMFYSYPFWSIIWQQKFFFHSFKVRMNPRKVYRWCWGSQLIFQEIKFGVWLWDESSRIWSFLFWAFLPPCTESACSSCFSQL